MPVLWNLEPKLPPAQAGSGYRNKEPWRTPMRLNLAMATVSSGEDSCEMRGRDPPTSKR
jgi:hypothetical protein